MVYIIVCKVEFNKTILYFRLKGFVLAFRNPKLLSNLGEMLYDSPFIHIDIEADFYLFRPTVGSLLKGKVNYIFLLVAIIVVP